ncbi:hypothetical protein Ocin01_12263 [Orchesella cincta]|uniref:Uncharacterized protein n=1 Tax=Orchesella cincta TaxID=48709 RepID=A0A1D2MNJ1_ORCCI|nr:hypothetical protein Ocin01_12263 [Orchesella cincta]
MLKYLPNVDLNFNMRMILILIAASSQLLLAGQAQPVNDGSPKKILGPISGLHREPRDVRKLGSKDPLDCLSQLVCGMNTYPPQKPSVRTNTANDFAYLLKAAVQ